jgi:hypothetical protein
MSKMGKTVYPERIEEREDSTEGHICKECDFPEQFKSEYCSRRCPYGFPEQLKAIGE